MRQVRERRDDQQAFVLHAYPYRETSLIVEALTVDHGRVAMVARGAKRPRSELRGVLQAFQPLSVSWAGAGELKTLMRAEWRGGLPLVTGAALLCGFYLNELLLKMLPREDPHPGLFVDYRNTLEKLAGSTDHAPVLRQFEVRLRAGLGGAPGRGRMNPTRESRSIRRHGTITPSTAGRASLRRSRDGVIRRCAAR